MSESLCASCDGSLFIEIESFSDTEESKSLSVPENVPDDVEFNCGCHYHWECFLEDFDLINCPSCHTDMRSFSSTNQRQVLCTVRNEGGIQEEFDILPTAIEENYLIEHPEERIGHAYLHFCKEGDVDAIANLLMDQEEGDAVDEEDQVDVSQYCGTFEGIEGSGLHVALRYGHQEVAWLLLALCSTWDWKKFPPAVLEALKGLGLEEEDRKGLPDIRSIKDSKGRIPCVLAEQLGGQWTDWVRDGRLKA